MPVIMQDVVCGYCDAVLLYWALSITGRFDFEVRT
jgi:hypothetical protein